MELYIFTGTSFEDRIETNEIREKYIKALQQADSQNYEPLIRFAKS